MTRTKPDHAHHHGNLRAALIDAGLGLLERDGPDGLTLRKCAALAGVSHAAPAHHFNGLISLQAAIVARGHQMFAQTMQTAADDAQHTPRAQLTAICDGYIEFARAHPALFKFMFQRHDADLSQIDAATLTELDRDSAVSYQMLRDACASFELNGASGVGPETMIWSLVHGYAMLFVGAENSRSPAGPVPVFADILPTLTLKK